MTSNCVFFKKNQIYWPLSFTGKLSSDFGLLSKMKSNLEDLYLNIKQCILILLKKYIIWGHNLVLLLLKKRTLFSKIPAVSAHESKRVSCCSQLWKRLYSKRELSSRRGAAHSGGGLQPTYASGGGSCMTCKDTFWDSIYFAHRIQQSICNVFVTCFREFRINNFFH